MSRSTDLILRVSGTPFATAPPIARTSRGRWSVSTIRIESASTSCCGVVARARPMPNAYASSIFCSLSRRSMRSALITRSLFVAVARCSAKTRSSFLSVVNKSIVSPLSVNACDVSVLRMRAARTSRASCVILLYARESERPMIFSRVMITSPQPSTSVSPTSSKRSAVTTVGCPDFPVLSFSIS